MIKALYRATPQKRKDILAHCSPDFLQSLCEISLNLLKGNIPLSTVQYKKLKRQKKVIKLLADKKTGIKRKQQILRKQSGGFILPLLAAAIPLLGNLFGGLIRK